MISADYSGQLTVLLRYPSPRPKTSDDGAPHHTTLLLRQAIALQMSPTPSTGASLMMENRNLLNIPVEILEPSHQRDQSFNEMNSMTPTPGRPSQRHFRQQTSQPMGLPEVIARGLLERGESLGINKTLMSAVSELRVSLLLPPCRSTPFHAVAAKHPRSRRVTCSFPRSVTFYIPPGG